MHNFEKQDINIVICILKYLKFASKKGILFSKYINFQILDAFINIDWAGSIIDS